MAVLLYLDRFCLSFAELLIQQDLGISEKQMGVILGAFFLPYALAQVPSGWFSDRFGARTMLTIYILLWSLLTALMGLATGFLVLLMLRLGFGLAQAGAYPTAAGVVSRWIPIASRGKASSAVAFGGRVGGFLAPILTAYLIVLLVPFDTPTRLESSDLLDARHLCRELNAPEDEVTAAVSQRVMVRLPQSAADIVREYGQPPPKVEDDADDLSSDKRSSGNGSSGNGSSGTARDVETEEQLPPLPGEVVGRLADGLNVVLSQPDLYAPEVFETFSVADEVDRTLETAPDKLPPERLERTNRLLLEAAYPRDIKNLYIAGWRPVMWVYGLSGLLVAGLFWLSYRNRPELHPACNAAEVELINHGRDPASLEHRKVGRVPMVRLLVSRSMWLCCLAQAGTNIGWVFLVSWLPRYLAEVHLVPLKLRGFMVAAPLAFGWIGMLYGGVLTDFATRKLGLRWGRALPMSGSRFLGVAAYLCCLLPLVEWLGPSSAPWALTALFCVVAFSTDLGVGAVWAFNQDVGGRHVGSVLGWGNMWGNLGATITPSLLLWVIGPDKNWNLAFLTCAAGFAVSGLASLGVNAAIPIVPHDDDKS